MLEIETEDGKNVQGLRLDVGRKHTYDMTRLLSIEINNFKTIEHGVITMPRVLSNFKEGTPDIVGIYGQNGSGKTCVIEVMRLLKLLWMGYAMDSIPLSSFIRVRQEAMEVVAELQCWDGTTDYTLYYRVRIKRTEEETVDGKKKNGATIEQEELRIKKEGKRHAMRQIVAAFDISQGFKHKNAVRTSQLRNKLNRHFCGELDIRLAQCAQKAASYIFSPFLWSTLQETDGIGAKIRGDVRSYATGNLFIVDRREAGLIACNLAQPLSVYMPGKVVGQMSLPLSGSCVLPKAAYDIAKETIASINTLLPSLIGDCCVVLKNMGEETNDRNQVGVRCELMVKRGIYEGTLANESEGIKRLISIIHLLIGVYQHENITVAVDELDSGIYEYLLGEILEVLRCGAKGQLIFTAHNLRPLEMLNAHSVLLTTNNPADRFTRYPVSRVKSSTNMRNMYMRSIQLGERNMDVETIIHSPEIAYSFLKAANPKYG